jgi:CRP-like cAMP-binding protein
VRRHRVDPKIERLASLPMLASAGPDELRAVAAAGDVVELASGTVLCEGGLTSKHRYLVIDGLLAMSVGREAVATVGRGELVGDDLGAAVTVISDVTALAIPVPAMRSLLATSESMRNAIIEQLETRVRQLLLR